MYSKSNSIRYAHRKNLIQYHRSIEKNIQILRNEFKILESLDDLNLDKSYTESIFNQQLTQNKKTWLVSEHDIYDSKYYVIINKHYTDIFFIFESQKIAEEFLAELTKLSINLIEKLAHDPKKVTRIQNEFWRNRIHSVLVKGDLLKIE